MKAVQQREPAPLPKAFQFRVAPEDLETFAHALTARIQLPARKRPWAIGDRLLLRGWFAGPTGVACLMKVIATAPTPDDKTTLAKTWAWSATKADHDLTALGYLVDPEDDFPLLEIARDGQADR